jgi:hypothetical protein
VISSATKLGVESILKFGLSESQVTVSLALLVRSCIEKYFQCPSDEWSDVERKFIEIIYKCLRDRKDDSKLIKLNLLLGRNGPFLRGYDWNVKVHITTIDKKNYLNQGYFCSGSLEATH